MSDLQIQHFSLDGIFELMMPKIRVSDQMSVEEYMEQMGTVWQGFTKWAKMNFDVERTINVPNFGNFQYKVPKQNNGEETQMERCVLYYPNENFLYQNKLKYRGEMENTTPTIKISFQQISKLSGDLDKSLVQNIILGVFNKIGDIINEHNQVELDLVTFGKFICFDRTFTFEPLLKNRAQITVKRNVQNKKTVRNLIESNKGVGKQFVIKRDQNKSTQLKPIQIDLQQQKLVNSKIFEEEIDAIEENSPMVEQQSPFKLNKSGFGIMKANSLMKLSSNLMEGFNSPTRRFNKLDTVNLIPEMLGAGTDPLAKDQDFQKLVANPSSLMTSQFYKPANAKIRFPPILDKFARTLAAPISGMKYNTTVVGRIASNYTPSAKRLYFDQDTKGVKLLRQLENQINFTANSELLQIPATLQEELLYITGKLKGQEYKNKMIAKNRCYTRYSAYITNEIPLEFIAPIRQYWITDILDQIPGDFQNLERADIELMINDMLSEINRNYYESVKKSIVDYVLKDEDERMRIGIIEVIDELPEFGSAIYKGIEPSDEWKEHVNDSRERIGQTLVVNSKATLNIMRSWHQKYSKMNFLLLSTAKDQAMTIQYFIKIQEDRINEVRNRLHQEWQKEVIDIYQDELNNTSRSKRYALLFFESTATLMSNLLRTLIYESLEQYRDFFKRFDQDIGNLKSPQYIVQNEENLDMPIEDVFLIVKLKYDAQKIEFADSLFKLIKPELLKLIDEIQKCSQNFPRPENNIARSEKTNLSSLPNDDEFYIQVHDYIERILDINLTNVEGCLNIYDQYSYLLKEMDQANAYTSVPRTRNEYLVEFDKYRKLYDQVAQVIPFYVRMNMILVDGSDLKKKYLENIDEVIFILERSIHSHILSNNSNIAKEIQAITENISARADVIERLVELELAIEKIRKYEHKQIVGEFSDIQKWLALLYETSYRISEEDLRSISNTAHLVHTLITKVDQEENRLSREREELEVKLREKRDKFIQNIDDLVSKIDSLKSQFTEIFQIKDANDFIDNLGRRMREYITEMTVINQKEDLLGWSMTEFPKLLDAQTNIKPYEDLWRLLRDFESSFLGWTKQKVVFRLDAEAIEKETKQMFATAKKLTFQLKGLQAPLRLANDQVDRLQKFQQDLPLIKVFSNPGLKERHWEEISQLIAMQVRPEKEIMLNRFIELDTAKHLQKLEEISDSASKEFNIEKILNRMQEDWDPISVELKPWKDTGTFIVGGACVDEVQTILDDQIVKTITMKGSPYAKIFENRINEWENWLQYTQNLFDFWIKVQGVWLYLEPVFTSPDILKHLAMEGTRFKEVDANWRSIMNRVQQIPKVIEFTKNRKYLETLKECHYSLEIVQKGLNAYLEGKRTNFPRFYFLSNDELLEILSETKDPTKVQPHLKKCFEGIQKLKFDNDKRIHGMYSSEGEFVQFLTQVDTAAARGNVDEWLLEVEGCMIQCIREVTQRALKEYDQANRKQWLMNRCGMAVLNMDMTFWTNETEKSLLEDGNAGVGKYAQICTHQLNEIVRMVRTEISKLDRCTAEAMIVLDVHNRDVLTELFKTKISKVNDFSWQAQLRYYWIADNTTVKIINAVCEYNYEYLGNSARLVITPLTDRCYRTLCGAIHLNYGGAPEGPAGTGKTETVKDLAKALARQCVVFNCSDGLDYKAMGKFFKGLASSGAWSCFDEFNRIDLEVLSVVAQQILTIQLARAKKLTKFFFEDAEIRLVMTCNCFITMNPGYAGRSDLPDNLKALFRSVAMMVPDYALIAEISLYSFGFEAARDLARKIDTTYKLCSEQLSSQDHYDYGMRAVKSVLTAAGNLKRKYTNENEFILMLRAINDVNLAKFLTFDIPLFKGIIKDLFPGISLPEIDYRQMYECIDIELQRQQLQSVPSFIEKIIQLYEMILVRHGLMVVGLPFGGKTSAIKVLAGALGQLCDRGVMNEQHVQVTTLNPKSITMKLLYGQFDEVSHEWYDGILAVKFRQFAKNEDSDRKWLVFDGPIDAVWIENMNTVLDDNKKLCLNSGEIIAMNKTMNMIFEPMDLAVASPATVSRCGMIYMEPAIVGWMPMVKSWMNKLPSTLSLDDKQEIQQLFEYFIEPLFQFQNAQRAASEKYEISPTQNQNLIVNLMRTYRGLLKDMEDEQFYHSLEIKNRINILQQRFLFSMVWSFGASVSTDFRKTFDQFIKRLCGGDIPVSGDVLVKKKIQTPDRGQLFEYSYEMKSNKSDGEWIPWLDLVDKNEQYAPKIQPHEILVKTTDTVRYSYLLNLSLACENPIMFCGPTGTGKSVYIKNVLNSLPKNKYSPIEIGFSAQTTCTQTQDIMDLKLERIRKGVYGPRFGKFIIFVDDLNMPNKEKYGAQPPIEILRQMLDQQGWYDYKDKEKLFKNIVDCIFVSAMGPPGGGRTFITPRILRHLSMISLTSFDDESLNRIFGTILRWFFTTQNFPPDIIKMESKIVQSTLEVYKTAMKELLPTPTKSHYLFNLRDFGKVILGVCLADKDRVNEINVVARLWTHEIWRVFADRLINDEDRMLILRTLREVMRKQMGLNFDTVFEHLDKVDSEGNKDGKVDQLDELRGLMFTDCMTQMGAPKRYYEEVLEMSKLQTAIDQSLENHNTMSDKPMDLVLFSFAVEHLLIIARIMKQPLGNGLLVGVGGSGRQSLTKLAAFVMEYSVVQIEISKTYGKNEWHEDLKKLLRQSGGKNENTVFLFTDSQIKDESFVEDINNLLNTSEVPNLYQQEEKIEVTELIRAQYVSKEGEASLASLYIFFIERVKKNLHIVLCFSPIGDAFRTRVRMFPSLVNCCTIDWFKEWPQDALVSVAKKFFAPLEMDVKTKNDCTVMVQFFHESTIQWAKSFYDNLKRKYYVTPTSYLELIITFKQLLAEKRREVTTNINKYENGLKKIIDTEGNVEGMQKNLIQLQPQLKLAAEQTLIKMKEVEQEKSQADVLKENISTEEAIVKVAVDEANAINADCQKDLDEALPALREAEDALKVLDKKDIDQLKSMKQPPVVIKNVMRAVCYILYPNPSEKMKDASGLRFITDWWAASMKLLNKPGLLNELITFDMDSIDEKIIKNLGQYLNDPEFKDTLEISVVANASECCKCMIMWVKGVYQFYFVNKKVKPKKAALAESEAKVNGLNQKLAVKQKELKGAQDKVNKLNRELSDTIANKEKLEKDYDECSKQLERAVKLIENLGGEKGRWGELAEELKLFYNTLTGDVLVSSGMIAYLGAFTSAYRNDIAKSWVEQCLQKNIPSSHTFSLTSVLGDQVKIRAWNIDGLPSDQFSTENAIIIFKARRWPLCIDPQGQANKWIKRMEASRKLQIIKLSDGDFLRSLENAIQFGKPVLLENVLEDLDPSLTPILLKQTFNKGSTVYIKLGENTIEYSMQFQFYITTKLRNPHYLPELSTKVTLLNFMITQEGLNDQLLGILVKKERPDLEKEKERLIIESANNKKQLAEIEQKILEVLSGNKNILTDETAIEVLTASKVKSNEIKEKQIIAEKTEIDIDTARQFYIGVSQQASCLFFAISDLNNIDPMYQYSLVYFIDLFTQSISKSEQSDILTVRLENLKTYFLLTLYKNICRSLFEKDKLLFSFLLSIRLMEFRNELEQDTYRFLLTGGIALKENYPPHPQTKLKGIDTKWLSTKMWNEISRLSDIPSFTGLYEYFYNPLIFQGFKKIYDSLNPHEQPLPSLLDSRNFSPLHKLCILRTIRSDKIIPAIQIFVKESLTEEFIFPPAFNLGEIYRDSSVTTPLIFVLSPGSDPFASLNVFAQQQGKSIKAISLGQGQGPLAQRMIKEGVEIGSWVVLQNCHLAVSWMPTLEKICEELSPDPKLTHQDFRLWLTSYPSPQFPTAILQAGIKMTNEPPKGLKANLQGSFMTDPISNEEFFMGCGQHVQFKKLLYGLCFFHAVIQERRKYGPLGWNIPYEFNESDLRICVRQLKMFLDEMSPNDEIPLEALRYLTAECNYGGRVTDDKDRRLISILLLDYYSVKTTKDPSYNFGSIEYNIPQLDTIEDHLEHIKQLPLLTNPQIFGFHPNADITKDMNETNMILDNLLLCSQEGGGKSGQSFEQVLETLVHSILIDFPEEFDYESATQMYPFDPKESMNTVLTQELTRFNKLISIIRKSLSDLKLALMGKILMSPQLERASRQLFDGKIPDLWMEKSYPSLKPLAGYVSDLRQRLKFFQTWINVGAPNNFWCSGFFFTQSFLTGVLQNYARKYTIPIDEITFQYQMLPANIDENIQQKPQDGAYIYGLYLEGCKWNYEIMELDESDPKVLFTKCPSIQLVPVHTSQLVLPPNYNCPLYKTSARKGVLSTTGHSTNFVMWVRMFSSKPETFWVKRGVALLTQLDD